jgi:hypothetical protein
MYFSFEEVIGPKKWDMIVISIDFLISLMEILTQQLGDSFIEQTARRTISLILRDKVNRFNG